ncbi:TraB/GumN family protein [Ruminococcus flavefaciens]|uniref:TraB/GumN family protein n=1 Tax=Ruminococcus flavefaciens TaxID=1265 RepID=UPI00048DBF69|nr:TraB/GumN family protein [Ruminococcus flavefaciens]
MKTKRTAAAFLAALCALCAFSCTGKKSSGPDAASESMTEGSEPTAAATEESTEVTSDLHNDLNDYVTVKETTPAMWKVTDEKTGNSIYMMGTMHMVTGYTYPLPDYIMNAYEECDGIAVEYDVSSMMSDFEQMQDFYAKLIYTDGTTVKDHLSEETYEKAKRFMTDNMFYNQMMDVYCVGFWEVEIETAAMMKMKNLNEQGIDSMFLSLAQRDGKEIVNVESLDIQTAAMTSASDELVDYIINELIDGCEDVSEYTQGFAKQYDLWASGDIDALDESDVQNDIPEELEDDYAAYLEVMLYDRNEGMAEKADEYLKEGKKYFLMVGASHFAGEKGVDDLLEEKGYTVERVA